jgi:hypothetical protein
LHEFEWAELGHDVSDLRRFQIGVRGPTFKDGTDKRSFFGSRFAAEVRQTGRKRWRLLERSRGGVKPTAGLQVFSIICGTFQSAGTCRDEPRTRLARDGASKPKPVGNSRIKYQGSIRRPLFDVARPANREGCKNGFLSEASRYIRTRKAYWLLPIVIPLLLVCAPRVSPRFAARLLANVRAFAAAALRNLHSKQSALLHLHHPRGA